MNIRRLSILVCAALLSSCGTGGFTRIEVDGDLQARYQEHTAEVDANPGDAVALAHLGAVALRLGRTVEAVRHLSRAASLRPADPEIARWHGEALLEAGRPLDAHRAFGRALEHDPEWKDTYQAEVEPRLLTGLADLAVRDSKQVRPVLALVDTLSPDLLTQHPEATGVLYEAEGDFRFGSGANHEAIAAYERALELRPQAETLRLKLGRAHAVLRQLDQAEGHFEAYVAAGGDPAERLAEIARFLEAKFLFKPARRYYERAAEARPGDHNLKEQLGGLLLKLRDVEAAREVLDAMLAGQKDSEAYTRVARLYLKYDVVEAALDTWKRAIELAPDDVGLWKVVARVLKENGRLAELEKLVGNPGAHEAWGDVYADIGDHDKAVARYEKAGAGTVPLKLARSLHKLGRADRRDKILAAYARAAADKDAAAREIATLYEELSLPEQAITWWTKLVGSPGESREAAFALARLQRKAGNQAAEAEALSRWAAAQPAGAERAEAWAKVADYWIEQREGKQAAAALNEALAQGDTPSRRPALMKAATVHRILLKDPQRAEELYRRWIETAPEAERYEARRKVTGLVRNAADMRQFHSRLLEDMVRERPDDPRNYYALAESYLATRPPQREEARRAFERFIELAPDKKDAILRVGQKLVSANAYKEAASIYARLAPGEISDPQVHLELARLYLGGQVDDKRRAREHLRRYLESVQQPTGRVRAELFRLAGRLSTMGLHDVAVDVYRLLLPDETNKERVLRPLGRALLGMGKDAEADAVYKQYLEVSGRSLSALRQVADDFYQARFYSRAREYHEQLFTPRNRARLAREFPRLVDIYLKLGDVDGLRDLAQRYVELAPNARAYADAAARLQQAGLEREAMEMWGKAAEKQPNALQFREQQARLALQLGDVDAALGYLREVISRSGRPESWAAAGQLLADRGFDEQALALYEEAEAAGVSGGLIHLSRGLVHLRAGQADRAHEQFVKAISEPESLETTLSEIAAAYTRAGAYERYIDILRRTAAQYPARGATWLALADVALELGRLDEARQVLARYADEVQDGAVEAGHRLWQAGDIDGARRYYEQALARPHAEGRDEILMHLLAALQALGRPEQIGDAIERYLLTSQDPADARLKLVRRLRESGFVAQAVRHYEQIPKGSVGPDDLLALGRMYLWSGDHAAAERAFQEFLGLGGADEGRVFSDQGQRLMVEIAKRQAVATAWADAGELKRALALLNDGITEHPDVGRLYVHKARLLLSDGRVLDAMDALEGLARHRTVDELDPGLTAELMTLIKALGREREALDILRRTSPETRSFPMVLALIDLWLRLGDTPQAQEEIGRVLQLSNDGALRHELGLALFRAGLYADAAELLVEVLQPGRGLAQVPTAIAALLVIARINDDGALVGEVVSRASRLLENRQQFHQVMAASFFDAGYLDEAADHARSWVAAMGTPPSGDALFTAPAHPWRLWVRVLLRRGDFDGALAAAEDFVRSAESTRAARRAMARLLRAHMAWDLAEILLKRAVEADQSDRESRLALGEVYLEQGQEDEAERQFERYLEAGDDHDRSRRVLARTWQSHARPQRATAMYDKLPAVGPIEDAGRVALWLRRGDLDKARAAIDASVQASPDPLLALVRYAGFYLSTDEVPAPLALELADKALAQRPEAPHPVAQLVKATALAELGRAGEGRPLLEAVMARGGGDELALMTDRRAVGGPARAIATGWTRFGEKALAGRDLASARWAFDRLVALEHIQGAAQAVESIRAGLDKGEWTEPQRREAVDLALGYLKLAELEPRLVEWAVAALSDLYERRGDLEGALYVYRQAIERFPAEPSLYNNLAYIMARRGVALEEALELVRQAIRLSPRQNLAFLDTEGWVLFALGRYPEAAAKLEAAVRHLTTEEAAALAETLYHLGLTYEKLDRDDDARRTLLRAYRADPDGVYGKKAAEHVGFSE